MFEQLFSTYEKLDEDLHVTLADIGSEERREKGMVQAAMPFRYFEKSLFNRQVGRGRRPRRSAGYDPVAAKTSRTTNMPFMAAGNPA